ncbi:MAG: ABC transporter substrate-binding protein [Alphaproteobacteria bacterium]|nr:ABC transporter substrate-binding protein [Alphaproteobacteria bacterium]TAD91164.1 MAG: ABC transporter substrate-binding protein [Alphaproteobacteria bacterium]
MKRILGLVAATAMAAFAVPAEAQQQLKVGFVATFSGPGGALGRDLYDGFMLGIEQSGGRLGGLTTEVIREDDQLRPDVGLQVTQKLLQRDRVDIITGVVFSNIMMAIYQPIIESQTFVISANAGPSEIAGARCSPFFFSTSWQNDQPHEAMGAHLQRRGVGAAYIMAPNYQAGRDALTGFKRQFKGRILDEVYTTVNQPDYSAELTALRAARPPATYVFYPGGMGVNFVRQYAQAGLTRRVPLYSAFTVDATTVDAQGEAALGTFGTAFWTYDLATGTNELFVRSFLQKHNRMPSTYAAQAYDSARLLHAALTVSNLGNKDALRDALRKADFPSVRGPFRFNNNHFPIQNFYLYETVRDAQGRFVQANRGVVLENHRDAYASQCAMRW